MAKIVDLLFLAADIADQPLDLRCEFRHLDNDEPDI